MVKQMARVQKEENHTRSELLREAWRHSQDCLTGTSSARSHPSGAGVLVTTESSMTFCGRAPAHRNSHQTSHFDHLQVEPAASRSGLPETASIWTVSPEWIRSTGLVAAE